MMPHPRPARRPVKLATAAAVACLQVACAGPLVEVRDFGSNPGSLRMFVVVPDSLPANAALVVVAHGCLQTAQDIAEISGWSELADAHHFAILYPQTSRKNDPFAGCFRTWLPEHQQRDAGEPLSVVQMVRWMLDHHTIDPRRVFITGMSSGGHLTNVMLATYPDVFAAGAPQSAFPYKCALSFEDVQPCCQATVTHSRDEWAELARSGYPGYDGPRPRVSIWHGREDDLLLASNLGLQREQWTGVLGIDDREDAAFQADGYTGSLYTDDDGTPLVQTFLIPGLGHAVAIDARAEPVSCGRPSTYSADVRICAAAWIGRWFDIVH